MSSRARMAEKRPVWGFQRWPSGMRRIITGSNCDEDAFHAARDVFGQDAEYLWHKDADLKGADVVILPGGFAHGDYLRTGAMARFSPIMGPVRAFAERGG